MAEKVEWGPSLFNSRYHDGATSRYRGRGAMVTCRKGAVLRFSNIAAPLSLIEKSAEIENCDREL